MGEWCVYRPCGNCPFLRDGGIRLNRSRAKEIAGYMIDSQGKTFACHKLVKRTDDAEYTEDYSGDTPHCAGALIFAEKNGNATQMMRIAERLRMYDPRRLMSDQAVVDSVFDDVGEMVAANTKKKSRVQ